MTHDTRPDPPVRTVDWPALVATAERHGVPVMRCDDEGRPHLIRTVAQLHAEWEA